jgi:hypothetical protein
MPNIKFNYLYRDSGNYKKFNSVIFSNPTDVDLPTLAALITSKLIWDTWFYAETCKLPEIFTDIIDFSVDPTWHEFEGIAHTIEESNTALDLEEFVRVLGETK